jgi:hypothetical protein
MVVVAAFSFVYAMRLRDFAATKKQQCRPTGYSLHLIS